MKKYVLICLILLLGCGDLYLATAAPPSPPPSGSNTRLDVSNFDNNLSATDTTVQAALETLDETAGGSGAPTDVDYWVGTADAGLSAEQVVNSAATLETAANLGAYASDILAATSEANFKSITNLEAGTDFYSISAADAAFEAELDNLAGLAAALSDEGAWMATVLGWADASAARTSLGLDSAANLETNLSLGAYASDLLSFTSAYNVLAGIVPADPGADRYLMWDDSETGSELVWGNPAGSGDLLSTNNLSDLTNDTTALNNLFAAGYTWGAVALDMSAATITLPATIDYPADSVLFADLDDDGNYGPFTGTWEWNSPFEFYSTSSGDQTIASAQLGIKLDEDLITTHGGSAGEVQDEVGLSLIQTILVRFDPEYEYDTITNNTIDLIEIGDEAPHGITLTEWKIEYVNGDPTTEIDLDLMCDSTPDWNPAAGGTVMDVLDTTAGTASADTGFDSASCANGSNMYLRFGADPVDSGEIVRVKIQYYLEED